MDFTAPDQQSLTWQKLKAHLEKRLAGLEKTAGDHLPEQKRAENVGRISEINIILGFEKTYVARVEKVRMESL